MSKKIAVILAGCGYLDGAEVRESVLSLLALDRQGAQYECFAPNIDQYHVINHLNGEEVSEKRNVLIESARIARGQIRDLEELDPRDFDAFCFPGGFGVAKNLSDFALKGADATVEATTKQAFLKIRELAKPVALACISPAALAPLLKDQNVTVTIGKDATTSEAIESMGLKHQICDTDKCVVDRQNKIVSTPAYMDGGASISQVASGIEDCISNLLSMC
jgi:enhancing lycopene biosynthesis protein 2